MAGADQGLVHNVTQSGNDFLNRAARGDWRHLRWTRQSSTQGHVILTAVIQGMRKEETNLEVRLRARRRSRTRSSLSSPTSRRRWSQLHHADGVGDAVREEGDQGRRLRVPVQIAELYHDMLRSTCRRSTSSPSRPSRRPRWSRRATMSASRRSNSGRPSATRARPAGGAQGARGEQGPERKSHNFVGQGLAHLVPLLLEAMCKQEEATDDETGTWRWRRRRASPRLR